MIHHSQTCINITTTHRSHDSIRHLNPLEKSVPLYGPSLPSGQAGFKNHEEFRRSPHLSFLSFTDLTIHSSFDDFLSFFPYIFDDHDHYHSQEDQTGGQSGF